VFAFVAFSQDAEVETLSTCLWSKLPEGGWERRVSTHKGGVGTRAGEGAGLLRLTAKQ